MTSPLPAITRAARSGARSAYVPGYMPAVLPVVSPGMDTRTIEVNTPDGSMEVYEVVPDTVRGGVVVVQEAFGVNDHIQDVTRRVAELGYHAVAPHFFHRAGGGVVPYGDF